MQHKRGIIDANILPAFVRPKEDELLSSWIVRLSHAHGLKIQTFTKSILFNKNVWNRDIDRSASQPLLDRMALLCDVSIQRAYETTLMSYEGSLFVDYQAASPTKWIIPAGIYHRTRRNHSLMYCPVCLQQDQQSYYRRKWRLALSVVCPEHQVFLLDRCYQCQAPVCFHRTELGDKKKMPGQEITLCHQCLADLKQAPTVPSDDYINEQQQKIYDAIEHGFIGNIQYSHLYFGVLRQVLRLLLCNRRRTTGLQKAVCNHMGMEHTPVPERHENYFTTLSLKDRYVCLLKALWLLDEWPDRFIAVCSEAKCFRSELLSCRRDGIPYWYWEVVMHNLYIMYNPFKHLEGYNGDSSYNSFVKKMTSKSQRLKH